MNENNSTEKIRFFEESSDDCFLNELLTDLRILVVDDDRISLLVLARMLQNCLYKVTKCQQPKDALSLLQEDRNRFDIVVIDLHVPKMEDGIKLLDDIVGLQMDLPVVIVSSDDKHEAVLNVVQHGACDYLIKPIRMEVLKIMWQHVLRKKRNALKGKEKSRRAKDGPLLHLTKPCTAEYIVPRNRVDAKSLKRKNGDGYEREDLSDDLPTGKKRITWTEELHQKFVTAVTHLGPGKAVPMKILEYMKKMNVHDITRENVASHLQKYRSNSKKQDDSPQHEHQHHFSSSRFVKAPIFNHSLPLGLRNIQHATTSSHFQAQSLTRTTQPSAPITLIPNNGAAMPAPEQTRLMNSKVLGSSYRPLTSSSSSAHDFPLNKSSRASTSSETIWNSGNTGKIEECEQGSSQHFQSLSVPVVDDFYDVKDDSSPLLIYDPALHLQHSDQLEISCGPFMELNAVPAPLQIKYPSSSWPADI